MLALMVSSPLHAQNLDAGKPPDKLFADGCAACHRSPRGLAKGRFSLTLAWFLRDHYASSSDTAKSLADYLVSVDSAPTTKPRAPARRAPASGSARPHP
jgi:mono/diheme cytochrome c family protein